MFLILFSFIALYIELIFIPSHSQVNAQRILNNEKPPPKTTFYRQAKYVWNASQALFREEQNVILEAMLGLSEDIAISFDMGWHKRYGFSSYFGTLLF